MEYQIALTDDMAYRAAVSGGFTYSKADWKTFKSRHAAEKRVLLAERTSATAVRPKAVFEILEFPDQADKDRMNLDIYRQGIDEIAAYLRSVKFSVDTTVQVNDVLLRIAELKSSLA